MIEVSRILDYVVEILKASPRPLVAKEICGELRYKGVIIDKTVEPHVVGSPISRQVSRGTNVPVRIFLIPFFNPRGMCDP
jgi:hypothetical protein